MTGSLDHEVVTTRDGALAIRDRRSGEVMHPGTGPALEGLQLYVLPSRLETRLSEPDPRPLVLFDVGLGAGSNALAARRLSESLSGTARRLEIISFERDLGALELALEPPHRAAFGLAGEAEAAARVLLATGIHETARTTWRLVYGDLVAGLARQVPASAEVVFWDPYSPKSNPELWTVAAFTALRRGCAARCTVHTYSKATAIRAALVLAGFAVGRGVATGSKDQTTCAATRLEDLDQPLDGRWLERLARSPVPLPVDAPVGAMDRIRSREQFRGLYTPPR